MDGKVVKNNPSPYLLEYMGAQGVNLPEDCIVPASQVITEQKDEFVFDE